MAAHRLGVVEVCTVVVVHDVDQVEINVELGAEVLEIVDVGDDCIGVLDVTNGGFLEAVVGGDGCIGVLDVTTGEFLEVVGEGDGCIGE